MAEPLHLSDLDEVHLTASQAFQALHNFLAAYAARLNPPGPDIATIVGDTEIESDGISADPAALSDWQDAIRQVLGPESS